MLKERDRCSRCDSLRSSVHPPAYIGEIAVIVSCAGVSAGSGRCSVSEGCCADILRLTAHFNGGIPAPCFTFAAMPL
jgi:hypothetical protein